MADWLRQSTAVDLPFGPFVDATDGVTPETGLTISQADVRVKKNGGAWAQKNNSSSATHEENGWYEVPFSTTDTDTLGLLTVAVNESGALPVWRQFLVVTADAYDAYLADGALYGAWVSLVDDNGGTSDRYSVTFSKNGKDLTSGITSPTIQVIKDADGTDLIASTALTQIGSTGLYRHTETTGRIVSGAGYHVIVTATIDGATRTIRRNLMGRDT